MEAGAERSIRPGNDKFEFWGARRLIVMGDLVYSR